MKERIPENSIEDNYPVDNNGKWLMLIAFVFMCVGIISVFSASVSIGTDIPWYASSQVRHIGFVFVALIALYIASLINWRFLTNGKFFGFPALLILVIAIILCLLVYIPGIGRAVQGRHRWLRFGQDRFQIGLQPSEVLKYAMIIFLSSWLGRAQAKSHSIKSFLGGTMLVGICTGLIIKEDLGMGIIVCFAGLMTMFVAGVRWSYIVSLVSIGTTAVIMYVIESPGKMSRVMAAIDPWDESNRSSYQARQALKSIYSGGSDGRGMAMGVQKLGFLPEDTTDFIFASLCEEWGMLGSSLLILLWLFWIWKVRSISRNASDKFSEVLAVSLGLIIAFQAGLHMMINMVLLPPTGVSMPFVSSGGTSLVLTSVAVGIIASISSRSGKDRMLQMQQEKM